MYRKLAKPLLEFLKDEKSSGYLLFSAVFISLVLANSPLKTAWHHLFELKLGPDLSSFSFSKPLHFWINELLMAVFFLLAGLEIKREFRFGELQDPRKASLPIFAALGGMIVPAIIYWIINTGTADARSWGIPMATDIAFSLAILALCGKRIPLALKIFLTTLALVDDLGAILVIALFYTNHLALIYLGAMAVLTIVLLVLNWLKVKPIIFYLIPGILLWYCTYQAGIHATISGVILALCIPDQKDSPSPLKTLEHFLSKPVAFLIMPLFALSNTAISFSSINFSEMLSPVSSGIMMGLILGKPVGIAGASILATKLKLSTRPASMGNRQLIGLGLLGGIGFSMSIFISLICYDVGSRQDLNCLAILIASIIAGLGGFLLLNFGKMPVIKKVKISRASV